jgi:hypothetical protein
MLLVVSSYRISIYHPQAPGSQDHILTNHFIKDGAFGLSMALIDWFFRTIPNPLRFQKIDVGDKLMPLQRRG